MGVSTEVLYRTTLETVIQGLRVCDVGK